jgi:hypothetical protein
LAGGGPAGSCRDWGQSEPPREETALLDALRPIALAKRFHRCRRLKIELGKEGWVVPPRGFCAGDDGRHPVVPKEAAVQGADGGRAPTLSQSVAFRRSLPTACPKREAFD